MIGPSALAEFPWVHPLAAFRPCRPLRPSYGRTLSRALAKVCPPANSLVFRGRVTALPLLLLNSLSAPIALFAQDSGVVPNPKILFVAREFTKSLPRRLYPRPTPGLCGLETRTST
jgi:hypothetical protein